MLSPHCSFGVERQPLRGLRERGGARAFATGSGVWRGGALGVPIRLLVRRAGVGDDHATDTATDAPPDAIAAPRPMPLLRPATQRPYPLPLHPGQAPKSDPARTNQAPQRLPLNPQEDDAANLQRIASASAEIQAILCNLSRPWSQPRDQQTRTARGSGGIALCDSPRRLSADFAGRKRPPSSGQDQSARE